MLDQRKEVEKEEKVEEINFLTHLTPLKKGEQFTGGRFVKGEKK
jgi:hypothetical protein